MRAGSRRTGFTLIEIMITFAILSVIAAIAVPGYRAARDRSYIRACYTNQKKISGAVEVYNLDFNTNITDINWDALTQKGLLQAAPGDPGSGDTVNSRANYQLLEPGIGDEIYCIVHGGIQRNP